LQKAKRTTNGKNKSTSDGADSLDDQEDDNDDDTHTVQPFELSDPDAFE